MTGTIEPNEAAAALDEIGRRRHQVIDGGLVPDWYWWTIAIPTVVLGLVVDTRDALAIGVAAVLYAVGVALLTGWIVFGGLRGVKVSEALLGPRGAGLIVGFVWLLVGGAIAIAFVLGAVGFGYPATAGTIACAAGLIIGGPRLMRRLRDGTHSQRADVR